MSVRAAFIGMLASRMVSLVVMLLGVAVLGRLVNPLAFGQFALLAAIFSFAQTLTEFGLKAYLIRHSEISPRVLSGAAGLSLAIAGVLCVCGLIAAAALPRTILPAPVALALVPLALALLLAPLTMGTEVLLQRAIDFDLIAKVEICRVLADVTIAICLAALGFGVVALACGLFAGNAAVCVALAVFGGADRRVRPEFAGWGQFSGFGTRVTLTQILPNTSEIAVAALVSGLLGAATMGLLNRAQTIQKIIDRSLFEGILPVVLPAISAALAKGTAPATLYYNKVDYLTAICWPGFACIALLADPLVMVLLGPDWAEAVPGVRILALVGLGLPFTKMSQKLFVATGLVTPYLRVTVVTQAVRIGLVLTAATVSFEAVCLALSASAWWKAFDVMRMVHRHFGPAGARLRPLMLRGGLLSLAATAGPALVLILDVPSVVALALAIPLAGLGWSLALLALRHPLAAELREAAGSFRGYRLAGRSRG